MAGIIVIGSVARDEILRMAEPLRTGSHLNGTLCGYRLGGGGANTAIALAAAGHRVTLVAAVGQDAAGEALLAELVAAGVETEHVARVPRPTTRSLILVDPTGERTVVNVARCEEEEPPRRLLDLPADAIYVRSRRRELAPLLAARAATTLVVAHVPPVEPRCRPAQVLVASRSDLTPAQAADPLGLGNEVAGQGLCWMVVTDGAAGARAVSATQSLTAAAQLVQTVDTTGAGDAFAAGLVHGLVSHLPMSDALALGARFGTEATLWRTSALPAEAVRRILSQWEESGRSCAPRRNGC
ncbi:MAG: hypothetical protein HY778_06985 [Betaproteobacteria bacterium]|nr:hypothetical protein [Betaproteobacteria bacterium]